MTKQNDQIYLTTPLYYVNARPHLGHSYTTILADVIKRHYVQRGRKVTFLTGTDEHGEKIEQMAKASGKTNQEFVDEVSAEFKEAWEKLNLSFDIFYRTTNPKHKAQVQKALTYLKEKGDIEFREYDGFYCLGCERYLTEKELTADGLCPDHLKKPEYRKEANYFFLMSKYQKSLIDYIEKNPNWIQPEHYKNEVLSFLKQPLTDLSISRPSSRTSWGIPFPFDAKHTTYVWFDALLNYLNATNWGEPDWKSGDGEALWRTANHLIAKDILKPHAIYWPTMLMALGVPLFQSLCVHGYWLMDKAKMSKSLGNVIKPLDVEAQYGRETLRFYLLREMSFGIDSSFTLESYVNCINAYLANGIGNLVSRVMTIAVKNLGGKVECGSLTEADQKILAARSEVLKSWNTGFDELKFQNSLKAWCEFVTQVDLYVNDNKPWALAKDPAQTERLQTVLCVCLNLIEALAIIVYPVLPQAAESLIRALGLPKNAELNLNEVMNTNKSYGLAAEVPKLFMRVQLPVMPASS